MRHEDKENCEPNEPYEEKENVDLNVQQRDDLLRAAQLKKKEVQPKKSRRNRTWIDNLRKGKKKNPKFTQGAKVYKMQSAHLFMLVINRTN